ncbi:hypothetical protein E2C01_027656 [Portunus trituberculatus]|uniref:Uncharacterized protein n=1 Tax=Portunus trituberculatus TaxID=210409 RepID=A0A5B7EMK2_PORTR|nr:hypothetical protein [Portunus trituberculatus]
MIITPPSPTTLSPSTLLTPSPTAVPHAQRRPGEVAGVLTRQPQLQVAWIGGGNGGTSRVLPVNPRVHCLMRGKTGIPRLTTFSEAIILFLLEWSSGEGLEGVAGLHLRASWVSTQKAQRKR